MTNSNQSNTPENPATLLNTSGSSDLKAASPDSQASSHPEELSIDDLDLATLERLTAPDAPAPSAAPAPDAEVAPEPLTAASEPPVAVAEEAAANLTVTEDTVIAGTDNTDPVSVNMMFDDEPRIHFDNSEAQVPSTQDNADSSELQAEAQAGSTAQALEAESVAASQFPASEASAPEAAAPIAESSFIADTSYSGDNPADAINSAPASAAPTAVTPAETTAAPAEAALEAAPAAPSESAPTSVAPEPLAASQSAPAPQAAAAQPAASLSAATQPAASTAPSNANIMGGATVMNAGNTAIMGLENRQVFHREKADLSGISDADRAAIEMINALNSRNRAKTAAPASAAPASAAPDRAAPAPQAAEGAHAASIAATGSTQTGSASAGSANIMGGATVMNAGHTAIMGLENRQVIHREKADLSGISDADRAAIEMINALNARNRGKTAAPASSDPAPQAAAESAPQAAAEPARAASVAATGTSLTGSAAAGGANIMGGATVLNAGHTAIMGLEHRHVAKPKDNASTLITGISEEDLATLQQINAQNARHRSQWAQAQAKFHAEIAAERAQAQESGNALDVPGYVTPHGHAAQQEAAALNGEMASSEQEEEGTSTLIYGAGAAAVQQNAFDPEAQPATVITGLNSEEGSGASLARNRLRQALAADQSQAVAADQNQAGHYESDSGLNDYDAQALSTELEDGIAGAVESIEDAPESFATAAGAQDIMEVPPQNIAGAQVGTEIDGGDAFTAQGSGAYGLSGNLGSALDDEPSLGAGVFAGAEPDDMVPGRNLGSVNPDEYAGIVGDAANFRAAQRPAPKVSSPIVTEENAPQIGLMDNEDVQRITANTPDLETKIVLNPEPYYDDEAALAAPDYTPAYPGQDVYPSPNTFESNGGYSQGQFAPEMYSNSGLYGSAEQDSSAFDGVVAAPEPRYDRGAVSGESPYITPGVSSPELSDNSDLDDNAEPRYVVGPTKTQVPDNADGPGYTVGPKVSSQDLAAQAGDTVYVVGPNHQTPAPEAAVAEPEAPLYAGTYADKLAREQAMRELAAAAVAVERTPELDRKAEQSMPPRTLNPSAAMMDEVYYDDDMRDAKALEAAIKNAAAENRTPSGMGDGVLSQFSPTATDESELSDGPRYVIGPSKRPSAPQPVETESDYAGPRYVVGTEITNAEVERHLQTERTLLSQEMALPPSYLDDEPIMAASGAQASDNGYEQELQAAAAESMAPPKSAAVDIGRKLAAEGMRKDRETLGQEAPEAEGRAASAYEGSERADRDAMSEDSSELSALRSDSAELDAMPRTEHVKLSMALFLFLRQLIASFFTHTTLPVLTPHLALRLGPCYPSSMAIPFFVVGLLVGALGGVIEQYTPLRMSGTASCLIFLLLTGLSPYRGIYRIFTFITRRRHDAVMMASSVMVSLLVFIGLISTLVHVCSSIGEFTLAFALASMLSAATASTLMWNFPQDPMDSCGTMTNKGLVWVMFLCGVVTFGFLHYIVALSILGVGIVMRLIFGYCIAKNQGTAQRPYVSALQLLTLFAILLDLILLKSQNYEFLNLETLNWLEQYAERLTGLA